MCITHEEVQAFFTDLANLFNERIEQMNSAFNAMRIVTNVNALSETKLTNTLKVHGTCFDYIDVSLANAQWQLNVFLVKATVVEEVSQSKVALPLFFDGEKNSIKLEK